MNVNIGAGFWRKDGWENLDYRSPHYDKYGIEKFEKFTDVEHDLVSGDPLPFKTNSVDRFYCCMVFEHIPNEYVQHTLNECHRCLKTGGSFLVVVPIPIRDVRQFIKRLNTWNWGFAYNHAENGRHINFFTFGKMKKMLKLADFDIVKKLNVKDVEKDFHSHADLAMYVEAIKL
jgi:predicted SAM-dependent methyltransferase